LQRPSQENTSSTPIAATLSTRTLLSWLSMPFARGRRGPPERRKAFLPAGNGCKMYLGCRGSGSATVVFVGGIRASAEDWLIADKSAPAVFPEVTKFTQVCAHDGPGTPVDDNRVAATRCHSRPRRGTRLPIYTPCSTACEAGSWVLVGQSYRGLIVSLYASTYPGEVSGLVLAHQLTGSERR